MPPQIALIICSAFVLWLIYLDHRRAPEVSFSMWLPSLWMLLISSKPLAHWFGTGGLNMESGSPLDRIFLSVIFLLGILILIKRKFEWANAIRENVILILLLGYMLISTVWSDMPIISLKRWVRESIAITMAFVVATEVNPKKALESIFKRTIYILIPFSYILIHYFPKFGREYARWSGELMWVGTTTQKNGLGRLCLFATIILIWSFINRKQKENFNDIKYADFADFSILMLAFWLMGGPHHNFTYSLTTNLAFMGGIVSLFWILWFKRRKYEVPLRTFILIIGLIIGYGIITPIIGKLIIIDISEIFGRSETLTGRSHIWEALLPYAMKKPIFGYGFGGFWTDSMRQISSSHAHNGYLDLALNLGLVGMVLFIIFLLTSIRKAYMTVIKDFGFGALFVCFIFIVVIHNIAESQISSFTGQLTATLIFLSVSSSRI